jgi:hypothetical protein
MMQNRDAKSSTLWDATYLNKLNDGPTSNVRNELKNKKIIKLEREQGIIFFSGAESPTAR